VKVYAQAPEEERRRYSPPEVTNAEKVPIMGNPDPAKISTSHVERQNLSIRMGMRRMTRLTNAFSKKWDNLWHAYCLWFAYYNFCRFTNPCGSRRVWRLGSPPRFGISKISYPRYDHTTGDDERSYPRCDILTYRCCVGFSECRMARS